MSHAQTPRNFLPDASILSFSRPRLFAKLSLPLLLLVSGAMATVWVYRIQIRNAHFRDQAFFAERVAEAHAAINVRVAHYIDALRGGAGHFKAMPLTDRESWRIYATSLDLRRRYPGINGIGVILSVSPHGVEAWKARVVAGGEPEPQIAPFPATKAGPEGDAKYLITVVETTPNDRPAIGRDIATEPSRRRAAELARDTGTPYLNQRIPGSRDTQRRAGLLLYVPIYRHGMALTSLSERRAAHVGWVFAQIFPDVFLQGVLEPMAEKLDLHFFEAGELSPATLLYSSGKNFGGPLPTFEQVTEMTLAGQPFRLGWTRGPRFPHADRSSASWVAVSLGLATLFLGGLVFSLQSISRQANAIADARTAELVASEERFRQAFDFAGIGMALVAMDGQLLRVNQAVCDILGYTEARLLQKKIKEITHPDDLGADVDLINELISAKRRFYQLEKRYLHRDGHSVWIRLTASLVRDGRGRPLYAIAQVEDIAERRRLEVTLANARNRAIEDSRSNTDFLATIVHQIRAPANDLVGTIARLRNRLVVPEQGEFVSALEASSEAFLKVLRTILDYWELEFNNVECAHEAFNLRHCINDAIAKTQNRAQEKGLRLEATIANSAPILVAGDAKRLGQIITTLLDFTIKFTGAGEVRLTLAAEPLNAATGRQRLKFAVRDTRTGAMANSASRSGGAIELAISKRLTELLGGMLWTENELGRGTTFHFTVAIEPRDSVPGAVFQKLGQGAKSK